MSSKTSTKSKIIKNSEMDENKHSVYNGYIKRRHPDVAEFALDFYNNFSNEFFEDDEESKTRMLEYMWGENSDSLEKLVKENNSKTKKENKKKETVFEATGLDKPNKAINIFGKEFTRISKEKGIKFTKEESHLTCKNKAWSALSEKEKEKYIKQADKEKETYLIEYEKQKAEAIKNGLFREDKVKGPLTIYFQFLAEIRPKLAEKFSGKEINIEAKKLWDVLSDKDKKKYETAYLKEKADYDIKKAKWNETEKNRLSKLNGVPNDVEIESSGNKTKESKESKDSKESKESKESKSTNKSKTVKVEVKTEAKTEDEDEEEDSDENEDSDEEEIIPEPKKSKKVESKKVELVETKKPEIKKAESKKTKASSESEEEVEVKSKVSKKPASKKSA